MNKIETLWSEQTVKELNEYQNNGKFHPYTCINYHDGDRNLIATKDGWICKHCDYKQNWAHQFSTIIK